MKSAKGYSLVITFTVAIETRDIRLSPDDSSVFSPQERFIYMLLSPKTELQIAASGHQQPALGRIVFPTGTRLEPQDMGCRDF